MKRMEADVIVVAAGPAGLAASISAAEAGKNVLTFEKANTTGGAGNMGMGPFAVETRLQRDSFIEISKEEAFDMHMKYTHYRVDADLVQAYFGKSADTISWLQEMGVEFVGAFKYFSSSEATWHIVKPENGVVGPRAASAMYKIMTQHAKEVGVDIKLETPVKKLIVENGKVAGVIAAEKGGEEIDARAKAVIIATGGFGDNVEMIEKYLGYKCREDYFPFMIPGLKGDGLNMCWEIGAAKYGIGAEVIYQLPDNLSWFCLDGVLRQPNLLINQRGDRFMNEEQLENTTFAGNAIALQPGRYAYCIMDEGIKKHYLRNGLDQVDMVHPSSIIYGFEEEAARAEQTGYEGYFEVDTIEELAGKLGIDADKLQDTIDEYNDMCDQNMDTKFGKNPKYLHAIGKGKLYVGKFFLGAYGSIGGLKINSKCQVFNEKDEVIPGLYAAGQDANTIYGDSYNFYMPGNSMGFAINTGRMAGEAASDYADEL
ncbi:fumarate reductase flavoprotein subunit [Anaerobacterium chartisolvens]|uniref:Fumarate reductase flavoprotein subunit n=1 Tax=Anaerobacterium chartisolvens TaxID=1297424 RepID=A0A369AKJ2_9FIRM|nr:FAD-dependent oxidoreductase [Anaerobacterium chartisolvens]RCX09929.1 fumarate reductase flavoprotein subunit [Anaerobacterium chartisolvens]